MAPRVLVVDNYDSFVYNLVQYLGELGAEPLVHRSDALPLGDLVALEPDAVLISPGPGRPEAAGLSNAVIEHFAGRRPVLGVCLGHQCIGEVFGGRVVRAAEVMHGKTSLIRHTDSGVFEGLPNPLEATRYHSLIVDRDSVPDVGDRRRHRHGPPAPGGRRRRGAVPSRVDPHHDRARPAAQLRDARRLGLTQPSGALPDRGTGPGISR
jgi:anthranilate synthase component II